MAAAFTSVVILLKQMVPEEPRCPQVQASPVRGSGAFQGNTGALLDDGPTQRASGSCGPRLFLIFWLKKALVPAFPDEKVHSEEGTQLRVLQSWHAHGLYCRPWNKQLVSIRNQEGKQLATRNQNPMKGPHPGSEPHTGDLRA